MNTIKFFASALLLALIVTQSLYSQEREIDYNQIQRVIQFSDSTGATKVRILYNEEVIGSFDSEDCDSLYMNTASMVKSWIGLGIGILINKELIESEDELVCEYLPSWKSGCENNVKIKHLLTMSSGLQRIRPASESILGQEDMNAFSLDLQLNEEPGTVFSYSNEGVQILGMLIEEISGDNANTFFTKNLFKPLGMDSTHFVQDKIGNDIVFGGARTTIQDASKIGLLMLENGNYDGKEIVSKTWIQKTLTQSENASYYGYLWWLDPSNIETSKENYAAMGDLGQMTIIYPKKELIYLRQQSCRENNIPNMSWMGPKFIELVGSIIIE